MPDPKMIPRMIAQPSRRPSSFFILTRSSFSSSVGGNDPAGDSTSCMTVSVGEFNSNTRGILRFDELNNRREVVINS